MGGKIFRVKEHYVEDFAPLLANTTIPREDLDRIRMHSMLDPGIEPGTYRIASELVWQLHNDGKPDNAVLIFMPGLRLCPRYIPI